MGLERWRYVLPLRLRSLFRGRAVDGELDEELQYHLERQIEVNVAQGMTPQEARYAALRALDGLEQHKETMRDHRRVALADSVRRDVHYAMRVLRKSPIFAGVAVLSLALGIGANAAIFQLVDALRLRSLPVSNPHELAEVVPDGPQAFGIYDGINSRATFPLWEQMRARQSAFASMFAWGESAFLVGRGAEAREARGLWVSGDFFPVLGIAAGRGRLLDVADDRRGCGAGPAVISHAFWQSSLGGRDSVVGSTLTVQDQPFTIVGVTPPTFTGLEVGQTFDIALPVCAADLWDGRLKAADRWWLTVMGRLQPEWTTVRASEQMRTLSQGLLDATIPAGYDPEFLDRYRAIRFSVIPAAHGVSRLRDAHGRTLVLLLGLTGLVLLITCGNLATLLLARASARTREIAVRIAIGASRPRLVSQMMIENLLLAAGGALLAIPVALASSRALVAFFDTQVSVVTLNLAADWRLLAFVGAVAMLTAILFGLVPALRASMADPIAVMRRSSRGLTVDRQRARFQRVLVVGQIAVSLVLVVTALLFVQTFRNLAAVDTGFERDGTIVVAFRDPAPRDLAREQIVAFQERLAADIRAVPGVAAAASSSHVPMSGGTWSHFFQVPGIGNERKASRFAYVDPGYFATLRIPVRSGRAFNAFDDARSRRVLVVNESFARSHLAGMSPLGAVIRTFPEPGYPETTYEIIGVVGDTKYADLRAEDCWCDATGGSMAPIAFIPIAQNPNPEAWSPVIVRLDTPGSSMASALARRVEQLDPSITVRFFDLNRQIRERLAGERIVAWLAGAFGALAMALVTIGLYGIIAYLATSRRNEIGIRLSLGSTRTQIARLVLRDNVRLLAAGLAVGLPLTVAATRSAGALLFGLTATDIPTIIGAVALLAFVATIAAAVPAWRAARIRPQEALRTD